MLRQLDETTLVSGQISPDEVAALRDQGVTMIVNHRPDCEEPGQPLGGDIKAAAQAAGIAYRHHPIARGIGPADIDAMQEAMREAGDGKLLLFCRSGNRSTLAWAVARAEDGADREQIEQAAARAGVDLNPVAHLL